MRLHAFDCGWLSADLHRFLTGGSGRVRVPVPAYLIEHPRGLVLFDSGLHADTRVDAEKKLGFLAKLFEVHFGAGEAVAERLEARGFDPAGVTHLVTSHLHFDHVGGHAQIPNARLVVQRREWEAGHTPELMQKNGYDPRDYELGHEIELADGELDLFGDGRIVCLPTYGHTAGHQSLRVRLDGGEIVLTADACYFRRTLEEMNLPPTVHDPQQMKESLRRLAALQAGGARLFFGHDPELWATLPEPAIFS
jgi:glyoxylase-like metal-dependent hydrolase (beta-lactamase superfamily II)